MNELVTTETILDYFKESVENKQPLGPHTWVDGAQKLNVLLGDEHDRLFDLQQKVSQAKLVHIESGDSVAKATARIEAGDEHKEMRKQQAKVGRIEEMIRIAKLQARLKDNEMSGY